MAVGLIDISVAVNAWTSWAYQILLVGDASRMPAAEIKTTVLLSLLPIMMAFAFVVFIFYRAKREAYFKQKEAELEMKAIRAQINPHFIFNCLNSIHHYMHAHDIRQAGDYLVKFSHLIRYVLETSSLRMVPLEDDLSALKQYIELEQLRLQHSFEYEINSTLTTTDTVRIPPMMLQPFVENSIWHGLNHKGSGGKISIRISRVDDMIQCVIEDNGTRNQAKDVHEHSMSIKKTSLGMVLVQDRLAMVSRIYKMNAGFSKEDRALDSTPQEGTRIRLTLPLDQP